MPGFLRGRRYLSTAKPLDFFTLYETESADTIRSAAYLARLNDPTPWTRRVLPHFRSTVRIGCHVVTRHGHGQGGGLLHRPGLSAGRAVGGAGLARDHEVAGVIGLHLLEPVPETTQIQTREKELRGAQPGEVDAREPWTLLVENERRGTRLGPPNGPARPTGGPGRDRAPPTGSSSA